MNPERWMRAPDRARRWCRGHWNVIRMLVIGGVAAFAFACAHVRMSASTAHGFLSFPPPWLTEARTEDPAPAEAAASLATPAGQLEPSVSGSDLLEDCEDYCPIGKGPRSMDTLSAESQLYEGLDRTTDPRCNAAVAHADRTMLFPSTSGLDTVPDCPSGGTR